MKYSVPHSQRHRHVYLIDLVSYRNLFSYDSLLLRGSIEYWETPHYTKCVQIYKSQLP